LGSEARLCAIETRCGGRQEIVLDPPCEQFLGQAHEIDQLSSPAAACCPIEITTQARRLLDDTPHGVARVEGPERISRRNGRNLNDPLDQDLRHDLVAGLLLARVAANARPRSERPPPHFALQLIIRAVPTRCGGEPLRFSFPRSRASINFGRHESTIECGTRNTACQAVTVEAGESGAISHQPSNGRIWNQKSKNDIRVR
jgi:hypothetical protein